MGAPEPVKPMSWIREAVRDERLGSTGLAVSASLAIVAPGKPRRGATSECAFDFYASVPFLMKLSKLGERSVRGVLSDLQAMGYLYQVRRGGRHGIRPEASTYRLTIPNTAPRADWEAPNTASGADWEPVGEAVDNPMERSPNLHETEPQPARDAVLREKDFQESDSSSVARSRTERARGSDDDEPKRLEDLAPLRDLLRKAEGR